MEVRSGSETAGEIYQAVGFALSWWESSEDVIEDLFSQLIDHKEPVAAETFRVAPRSSRTAMIKSALQHHSEQVSEQQEKDIIKALKELEKLAPIRNRIAHGYVMNINTFVDNKVQMKGNFLASTVGAFGSAIWRPANYKFAMNAAEILEWVEEVRLHRGKLLDVYSDLFKLNCEKRRQPL